MNKTEVQKRVLLNGRPLNVDLFEWDETTRTFSSNENRLVLDFKDMFGCTFATESDCTFNTGSGCTFNTGSGCTFNTGAGCTFNTGSGCTFNTWDICTFKTGFGCTFKTGFGCTFKTLYNCTFTTESGCTFTTGAGCTFTTGSGCTFKTWDNCTFTTGSGCTFKTLSGCTFVVNNYSFPVPPLRFNGSRYFMEASGPDLIRSGCIEKPAKWWADNVRRCAEEHNYTPEQIDEYELYVNLLAQWFVVYGNKIERAG